MSEEGDEYLSGDDKIIHEAQQRFERCEKWEGEARKHYINDVKFANGDSDNLYQWPDAVRQNRDVDQRPCLTINKTRQHNLMIVNDAKKNKPSVTVRPVSSGASYEAAEAFEGIVRHIEYISNAQVAYDTATTSQVEGGVGYWRVLTDYENDDSFDQEIFIRRIPDPLAVFLDPDCQEMDCSDARFGFIFEDMPRDEFKDEYPDEVAHIAQAALGNGSGWIDQDHVRVAEYYRRIEKKDKLLAFNDPDTGELMTERKSSIPQELYKLLKEDPTFKSRDIIDHQIEWYKIVGDKIIDTKKWLGKYVPIVKIVGEETVIDGMMDRKGHTRALKDPQRMYNYYNSSGTEQVALQGKQPWLAPAEAIEGYESYWRTANTINYSVLPYNAMKDDGTPIPAPQRTEPAEMAEAYLKGMQVADQDMMGASGQYQAQMGAEGNEVSGKAIAERQRQGDTATYHFIDNLAIGVRYTGKILIDLIPKVYDTKRIRKVLGMDGSEMELQIDPMNKQAFHAKEEKDGKTVKAVFNPSVGQYDVQSDVGPAYSTQRQEAFNAFSQIAQKSPELMSIIGDLLFKSADFPGADEIAERLERMVPPQAKGGVNPAMQDLQNQVQQLSKVSQNLMEELTHEKLKVKTREEQKDIDQYKAITDRLDVIAKHFEVTSKDKAQMLHDVMMQEHQSTLNQVEDSNAADLQVQTAQQMPQPQAAQ